MPTAGYSDNFGKHASFCYSCHDPNNAGARLQFSMAKGATEWQKFYANRALMVAPGVGELGAVRGLGMFRAAATLPDGVGIAIVRNGEVLAADVAGGADQKEPIKRPIKRGQTLHFVVGNY